MAKFLNRWAVSLVVAVLLTSCGIFHFADPLAMEEAPSDLSGVKDLMQVHADAGTEPMGFCAKEYALQGSSSKLLACWDGNSLPSLGACDGEKWKAFPIESNRQSVWGFASTFMRDIDCSIFTSDPMYFLPNRTVVIKIWHKRLMPTVYPYFSLFEYQLLDVSSVQGKLVFTSHASWKTDGKDNDYLVDEIQVPMPGQGLTSWSGVAFKAAKIISDGSVVPGWLIRGLAIIQK